MPMPSFVRKLNRRFVNPGAVRGGKWPVLIHRGRSSGKSFETPIGLERTTTGYAIFLVYGLDQTDWAKNVMHAGSASIRIEGDTVAVGNPRVVSLEEARADLVPDTKFPPGFARIREVLLLDPT